MDILNGFPIKLGCFWNKNIFAICSKICAKENNEGNKKVTVFQDKQTFINVVAPSVSGVLRGYYLPFFKAFTMKIYLTHGKKCTDQNKPRLWVQFPCVPGRRLSVIHWLITYNCNKNIFFYEKHFFFMWTSHCGKSSFWSPSMIYISLFSTMFIYRQSPIFSLVTRNTF